MPSKDITVRFRITGTPEANRQLATVRKNVRRITDQRSAGRLNVVGTTFRSQNPGAFPGGAPGGGAFGGGAANPFAASSAAAAAVGGGSGRGLGGTPPRRRGGVGATGGVLGAAIGAGAAQKSGLVISKSATGLLALSSVLGPLNSKLGQAVMTAGFAAFSYGAVAAGASLAASAMAVLAKVLIGSVKHAKKMGLELVSFSKASADFQSRVSGFQSLLGIRVQKAFVPIIRNVTELFKELEKLPWDDIISSSAIATQHMIDLAQSINFLSKFGLARAGFDAKNAANQGFGLKGERKLELEGIDAFGLLNLQRQVLQLLGPEKVDKRKFQFRDFAGLGLVNLIRQSVESFGPGPSDEDGAFERVPRFSIGGIDNLGRDIQKSILKQEGKDRAEIMKENTAKITRQILSTEKNTQAINVLNDRIQSNVNPGLR